MKLVELLLFLAEIKGRRAGGRPAEDRPVAGALRAHRQARRQGRGAIEGQSAEGAAHRHAAARSRSDHPRRAAVGPRSREHGPGPQSPRATCASEGKTILLSTHMMGEAEKMADEIILIHRGKVVLEGTLDEVRGSFGKNTLHIDFDGDGSFLSDAPAGAQRVDRRTTPPSSVSPRARIRSRSSKRACRACASADSRSPPRRSRRSSSRRSATETLVARGGAMNKMFAVMKREYLQAVRKKMFIIMTLLFPFLMAGAHDPAGPDDGQGHGREAHRRPRRHRQAAARRSRSRTQEPRRRIAKEEAQKAMTGRRRGRELPAAVHDRVRRTRPARTSRRGAKPYLDRLTPRRRSAPTSSKASSSFPPTALADRGHEDHVLQPLRDRLHRRRSGSARLANKSLQRLRLERERHEARAGRDSCCRICRSTPCSSRAAARRRPAAS